MNADTKKLWLEALRSGEYRHGTGCLCREWDDGPRWSALGVLIDVACEGHWVREKGSSLWKFEGQSSYLPPAIGARMGLGEFAQRYIARTNDTCSRGDFRRIADSIEVRL